jgi:voltage-gated potassium channel
VSGASLLVYVASLAVLQAERPDPHADIKTFGQAAWWAITTVTTVGYRDLSPVTTTGRVIARLLMVGGFSLVGAVTATLASWLVQRVAAGETASQAATAVPISETNKICRLLIPDYESVALTRELLPLARARSRTCRLLVVSGPALGHLEG